MSTADDYAEVRTHYWPRALLAALETALLFIVFLSMAGIEVAKILELGFAGHFTHFTNWAWSIETLFYGFSLAAALIQYGLIDVNSAIGRFTCTLLVLFFFPVLGIVAIVAVVVFVLLGTNAQFLADLLTQLPPTIVMLGNDVFHMIPVIFILIYFLAFFKLIIFSINRMLVQSRVFDSPGRLAVFILYQAYAGTGAVVIIYALIFDPHEVYKTTIWTGAGLVVGLLTLTVTNLIPLMIILWPLGAGQDVPYSVAWLVHNDYNPIYAADARWAKAVEAETVASSSQMKFRSRRQTHNY